MHYLIYLLSVVLFFVLRQRDNWRGSNMEGYDIILTNLQIKDVADTGVLFGSTQSPTVTVSIKDQSFSTTR